MIITNQQQWWQDSEKSRNEQNGRQKKAKKKKNKERKTHEKKQKRKTRPVTSQSAAAERVANGARTASCQFKRSPSTPSPRREKEGEKVRERERRRVKVALLTVVPHWFQDMGFQGNRRRQQVMGAGGREVSLDTMGTIFVFCLPVRVFISHSLLSVCPSVC